MLLMVPIGMPTHNMSHWLKIFFEGPSSVSTMRSYGAHARARLLNVLLRVSSVLLYAASNYGNIQQFFLLFQNTFVALTVITHFPPFRVKSSPSQFSPICIFTKNVIYHFQRFLDRHKY